MRRSLTSFLAAAALAIGGLSATAAAAQNRPGDDAAAAILGLGALGLFLNQQAEDQPYRPANTPGFFYRDDDDDDDDRHHSHRKDRRRLIPAECVIGMRFDGRYRDVVSAGCLNDYGFGRRLPGECAFDVRYRGRYRTVYGSGCLRDYGYRIGSYRD